MNPLLLSALMSFAPGLLSSLFGDPRQKYLSQVRRLTSAQNVGRETDKAYQNIIGGPAFSQAQSTIAAGANQASNQVAQNLAARGIGTSGTGAVLSGLTPSLVGSQMGQLRTSAHTSAQEQANRAIQAQLNALSGTYGQASPTQQAFGTGLEAFLPFLQSLLQNRGAGGQGPSNFMGQPGWQYQRGGP